MNSQNTNELKIRDSMPIAKEKQSASPKKMRWNVIRNICAICDVLVGSNFAVPSSFDYTEKIERLKRYFNATEKQVWIMCYCVWSHFNDGQKITMREFSDFLASNVLRVADMNKDFVVLGKRNYIDYYEKDSSFIINDKIIKCVLNNEEITPPEKKKVRYTEFVSDIACQIDGRNFSETPRDELFEELLKMENENEELPLVERCKKLISDKKSRFIFYEICNDFLVGFSTRLENVLDSIYERYDKITVGRQFIEEKHILLKHKLIEYDQKGSLMDATLKLSEKGKKIFLAEDYDLYAPKLDENALIKPDTIREKTLFYSTENAAQIENLTDALQPAKFRKIQKRLEEKGLPTGIAVILYGAPGCGKTESVYQIAKKTGRMIFQVDISDTKSCFFGESEKRIKEIFANYKAICEKALKSKNCQIPIMLVNECDAVFSKRKSIENSSTAQTENAIQNIILQEMENLKGILIATTNLSENLDAAFERRFLFKVRFENPSTEAKKAIWKDKISWLSSEQAEELASNFNFSGGEIDNIMRKTQMHEIIKGSIPSFSEINDMCRTEKMHSDSCNTNRIGFVV